MIKVLCLPLLQIPSGHHQAADTIIHAVLDIFPSASCEKAEILSYRSEILEKLISSTYLKWIGYFPAMYSWIYRFSVCRNTSGQKHFKLYEQLYLQAMKTLIEERDPDLIICTHALPSYLVSKLKRSGKITIPAVNAYTDFFIHQLWGTGSIDYHLVGHPAMKELLKQRSVEPERIFMTGIPFHKEITKRAEHRTIREPFSIFIAGGSLGIGPILSLLDKIGANQHLHYTVLCGRNAELYRRIKKRDHPRITPLPYIDSRAEMNMLYDQADAIITKPGGVTITESLAKRLPVFIYHSLPGQEEINYIELEKLGVVHSLMEKHNRKPLEQQLFSYLTNSDLMDQWRRAMDEYHKENFKDELNETLKSIIFP
ncbi:MGDG synthase family glycosyltransferase [Bacillus marinisedimentorum]|uniref:MGDG synthase family glycosyltransferase n=1 Tax=Bacillus marinisedimentorum TaxID=1821260 RepID=UPI0008733DD2|nr:glycosyltransferase [Bacillus marinisedimentorum]